MLPKNGDNYFDKDVTY